MDFDIVVLVRNEIRNDPRVNKSVCSIAQQFRNLNVVVNSFVDVLRYPREEYVGFGKVSDEYGYSVKRYPSGVTHARTVLQAQSHVLGESNKLDKTIFAFFYIFYLNIKFFWLCKQQKAKLYYANDLDTLLCGYLLKRLHGGELIYDSHELFSEMYPDYSRSLKWCYTRLEKFLVGKCNFILTVNNQIACEFVNRYGVVKPYVVMNCPNFSERDDEHNRCIDVVLYIGGYQEHRRLEQVIESMKYTEKVKLHLIGWGLLESYLRELVNMYGIKDKVTFIEPIPMKELVGFATKYRFGIIPYMPTSLNNKYSTPNKLFEYMHAGVIPIYPENDLPAIREIMNGIGVASGVNMDTPRDISNSLEFVISNMGQDYDKIKQTLIEFSKLKYNWGVQYLPILERIATIEGCVQRGN